MNLLASLKKSFPSPPAALTDEYIEHTPDPTEAEPLNEWLVIMPAYMSWCIRSPFRDELLVLDHTVTALANFGRFTDPEPNHLNFRSLCSPAQRAVVIEFLNWCNSGEVLVLQEQVERSIRQWQRA